MVYLLLRAAIYIWTKNKLWCYYHETDMIKYEFITFFNTIVILFEYKYSFLGLKIGVGIKSKPFSIWC